MSAESPSPKHGDRSDTTPRSPSSVNSVTASARVWGAEPQGRCVTEHRRGDVRRLVRQARRGLTGALRRLDDLTPAELASLAVAAELVIDAVARSTDKTGDVA